MLRWRIIIMGAVWGPIGLLAPAWAKPTPGEGAPKSPAAQLVSESVDDYLYGNHESARTKALKALQLGDIAAAPKAWRMVGVSSCFLHDLPHAVEAWRNVNAHDRQFIEYVCMRNALEFPPELRGARKTERTKRAAGQDAAAPTKAPRTKTIAQAAEETADDREEQAELARMEKTPPAARDEPAEELSPQQKDLVREAADHFILGDYEAARHAADRALEMGDSWRAWRIAAASSCMRGDRDGALRAWPHLAKSSQPYVQQACQKKHLRLP